VKARAQELSEFDTRSAGIGSAERSATVESWVFAHRNGHVADLEPFEGKPCQKNLVNLWMAVDNFPNSVGERFDGCGDKRTVSRAESHPS